MKVDIVTSNFELNLNSHLCDYHKGVASVEKDKCTCCGSYIVWVRKDVLSQDTANN